MRLIKSLFGQGYSLFVDNFYSSVQLCKDLLVNKITMCGTILINRRGIPSQIKSKKQIKSEVFANGLGRVISCFYNGRTIKQLHLFHQSVKKVNKFIHCKRRRKVKVIFWTRVITP